MRRKTIALMMALTLSASLSACGEKPALQADTPDTTSVEETAETTEEAEVTEEESTPEEEPTPEITPEEKVQSAIGEMPYYGDTASCKMTAEQATAYAQLIADGIAGDFSFRGGYDESIISDIVSWNEPFYIYEYDNAIEVDRNCVILADLSGDGVPYLYLYSSNNSKDSYEIYGWTDNTAKLAFDVEANAREGYYLYEDENDQGKMKLTYEGAWGMAEEFITYSFVNGVTKEVYTRMEELKEDNSWHVTENGVEINVYTQEEYDTLTAERGQEKAHEHTLPYTCFYDMTPCTLEEMVNYLNVYASVMSDGQSVPVEIKKVEAPENNDNTSEIEGIPEKDLQDINYSIAGNDIIYGNKTFKDLNTNVDLIVSDSAYDKDTLIRFILYIYKVADEEIFTRATHDVDVDMEEMGELGLDYNDLSVHEMMEGYPEYAELYGKYNEAATWMLEIYTNGSKNIKALVGCKSYIAVIEYGY